MTARSRGLTRRVAAATVVAVGVFGGTAHAAAVARSFDELQRKVKPGKTVTVVDTDGQVSRGRIESLSGTELVLDVSQARDAPDRRTFTEANVREVQRHRSGWLGPTIGLGVGIATATWLCQQDGECGRGSTVVRVEPTRGGRPVARTHVSGPLMLASLIAGPLVGWLADRPTGDVIIYLAPLQRLAELVPSTRGTARPSQ